MGQRKNRQSQRGFTVQEMLLVILISVILLSLSLVGIVTYLRHLQIQELDNGAREIFLAAQNRAILLSGGQRLEGYVVKEGESNKIEHVDVLPDLAETGETTQITVYYIHSTDSTAMDQLLPQGTIDPTLREGDFYIVYEPESASVVDVFYSDDEDGLPVEDDNFPAFYAEWRAADKKLRMDNRPMIGYYGGEAAESGTTISLRTPVINIYNDNELKVEVTYWVPRTLVMAMVGTGASVNLDVNLEYAGGNVPLQKDPATVPVQDISYYIYTYTWTLDSLEDGKQFQDLFSGLNSLTYGEDFTISAEVFYTGELKVNGARKTATDNSLFAKGSGDEVAYISCLRHLQNLDKAFSGVAGKTAAEQTADIKPVEDYIFQPVNNEELKSYDGMGFTIDDLTIKKDAADNVGLFGEFKGTSADNRKTLKNIQLVNTTVTGGTGSTGVLVGEGRYLDLNNCQVYWENRSEQTTNLREVLGNSADGIEYPVTGTGSVGGLAGSLTDASLENCAAATLAQNTGTGTVGGLVGTGSGLTIARSYGANYLSGTQAGGLVGNLTDTANITASYAVGFIDSGIEGTKGTAAGLCLGTGDTNVKSSYSAMLFTQGATNYPLCQSGTYETTCYLQSDYINQDKDEHVKALGKSYSDLIDRNKWDELFGSDVFTAKTNSQSHPYNLQTTLLLNTYNYPGLADLDHWGDWGAQFQDGSLVYYEKYKDGNYAFAGYIRQDADEVVVEDGYAVAYRGTNSTASIDITLHVTYDGNKDSTKNYKKDDMYEVESVKDVNGKTDTYYLLPLPGEVVNTDYASDSFYQKITIGVEGEETTKTYSYNPHFANAILDEGDQVKLDQLRVEVRSPRHLYQLSRHEEYYNSNHQYRFLQQLDLDYTTYTGYGLFDGVAEQTPIGISQEWPFRGNYYGNCHQIKGVKVLAATEDMTYPYVGLFGYTTGVLQDVVYQMPDTLAVTSAGSSETRYVGGLVGYNGGTITNCAAYNVQLKAEGYQYSTLYLGGLVGRNAGAIRRSAAEGAAITANTSLSNAFAGGLVGINENVGSVDQCYAVGKVSANRARHGEVYACGFAGRSEGTIRRSYAAVGLTVSWDAKAFGFCADKTTDCVYLNNGNFTYRNQHYAAQYADTAATAVTWMELTGKIPKDEVTNLGMRTPPVKVYDATETYPYPGIVTDSADQSIHYGQWPDSMDLGEMGIYYWEKMTIDGKDTYYLSAISQKDGEVYQSGTLSTAHGDGGVVTEYGYGYFYAAGTGEPILTSTGIGFSNSDGFTASLALENGEANTALSALLDRKYIFHSYNTWGTRTDNQGLFTVESGNAQGDQPPYGTWTLSRNGNFLTVKLNPFFANAMSCDSGSEKAGVSKALPGTKDNPYEVRSIDQLQFINWNSNAHNTVRRMDIYNLDKFPYLCYGGNGHAKTIRAYHWEQTHDLEGKKNATYTPIAAVYDEANESKGVLFGWFGGTYNGKDYMIADVSIATLPGNENSASCVGLFGAVFNGTLKNIVLYSETGTATVEGTNCGSSRWYAIGGLVGLAGSNAGSAVENCTVSGYIIKDTHESTSVGGWGGTGLGGLIGVSDMSLKNCTAVTKIELNSVNNDHVRVGGLVGSCQNSISSCYAGGSITIAKAAVAKDMNPQGNAQKGIYVGGIVGGIYLKPLTVGGNPNVTVGKTASTVGGDPKLTNTLNNCYTYVELPAAGSNDYIKGLYAVGGSGELTMNAGDGNWDHGYTVYNNTYYLKSIVLGKNNGTIPDQHPSKWHEIKTDIAEENNVTPMTYAEMADTESADGLLSRLNNNITEQDEKFATVTTKTASGAPLAGRYSFGSDLSLLGKDYPFPTILTQSSDVAENGIANVHYGDWPLEGIRRPDGALPVNLDLFADYKQEQGGAVKVEELELSGVSPGGTWSASSDKESVVKAEVKGSGSNGILTITALGEGNTTVTVTYTLGNDVYSLTIEVNVTAQLRLAVASGVNTLVTVFPNATVSTPLALTDKDGHPLSADLKAGINLDSINVEFDPDYFTDAQVVQGTEGTTGQKPLTLTADSGAKAGPTQMTTAYQFTYLDQQYSATSVLSLQVENATVKVTPLEFTFPPDVQNATKAVQYPLSEVAPFTIKVGENDVTVEDITILDFDEVTSEQKSIIWAEWAKNENDGVIPGTLSIEAYSQTQYPVAASIRLQYQFTYQGSTHTMWQDLAVTVTNQKETEGVVTP